MMTPPATCDSQPMLVDDQAAVLHGHDLVQRTTPVSVSTMHLGDLHAADADVGDVLVVGLVDSSPVQMPVALGLLHAQPGAGLLPRPRSCPLVLSTTLPGSIARSSFLASELRRRSWRTGRRGPPWRPAAWPGPVTGRWCCRPSRSSAPYWLSPSSTVMSPGSRPRISATTMAVTVRWAVPRSCVEDWAVTEPSAAMMTVHSLVCGPACAAPGVQRHADAVLDRAPCRLARRVPLLLPVGQLGGDRRSLACRSCSAERGTTAGRSSRPRGRSGGRFFSRTSSGSMPELGRQIVDGGVGQEAALRMARGAHGPLAPAC